MVYQFRILICCLILTLVNIQVKADGCSTNGNWSQLANSSMQVLKDEIKKLDKEKQKCGSFATMLSKFEKSQLALQDLSEREKEKEMVKRLNDTEIIDSIFGLFDKSGSSGDGSLSKVGGMLLQDKVMSVAKNTHPLASIAYYTEAAVSSSLVALNSALDTNLSLDAEECLGVPDGVFSSVVVGASMGLLGALSGNKIGVNSNLFQTTTKLLQYIEKKQVRNLYKDLSEFDLQRNLSCLIEITQDNFCAIQDAKELYEEVYDDKELVTDPSKHSPIDNYTVLNTNLPIMQKWLLNLTGAIEVQSVAEAERMAKEATSVDNVANKGRMALGLISDLKKKRGENIQPQDVIDLLENLKNTFLNSWSDKANGISYFSRRYPNRHVLIFELLGYDRADIPAVIEEGYNWDANDGTYTDKMCTGSDTMVYRKPPQYNTIQFENYLYYGGKYHCILRVGGLSDLLDTIYANASRITTEVKIEAEADKVNTIISDHDRVISEVHNNNTLLSMKKILRYLKNLRSYFSTMRNDVFYHLGCPVDKEVVGTIAVKHTNNMPPKVDNVDPNGESNEDYPEDEQYEEENASLETQAVEDLLEGQMEYLTLNCADGAQLIKGSSKNFDYDILDISMTGLTNNINMLEGMIPNLEQAIKVIEDFAKTSYLDHSRQTEATKVVSKLSSLFKMSDNGTRYFTERINVLIDFDMNLISQLGVFEDHLSNWLKVSKNVMKNLKLDSAVDTEADLNTAVIQSYTNLKTLANITKDRHIKAIKMLKTFIDGGYNEDSPIFSRVDWKYDAGPSYTEILTTKNDEGETSWLSNIWNAGKKLVSDTGKLLKVSNDPQVKIDALNDLIHHRDRMLNGWKLFPDQSSEKLSGLVSDKSSYQYFLARLCFQSMYWANQEDQQLVDRACEGVVMETKAVSGKLGYKRSEALKKMLRLEYRQIKARFKTPEKRACIMRNFRRNNKAAEFMGQLNLK